MLEIRKLENGCTDDTFSRASVCQYVSPKWEMETSAANVGTDHVGPGVQAYRPCILSCPSYKTLIKCGMQMNSCVIYCTMRDRCLWKGKKYIQRGKKVLGSIRRKSGTISIVEIIIIIIKKIESYGSGIRATLLARLKSPTKYIIILYTI